ncbi:HD domain-containing phosphohydrolase [Mucisphaera sp.]|uniref:HD domain-containing phosphohydrolase n=1 Tax=Mucisphaera sp. TaxID=2913024 RepID=UPI003D14DC1A
MSTAPPPIPDQPSNPETQSLRAEIIATRRELAGTYEELSLIDRIASHVEHAESAEPVLDEAIGDLAEVARLRLVALALADDQPRLTSLRGKIYFPPDAVNKIKAIRAAAKPLLRQAVHHKHAWLMNLCENPETHELASLGTHAVAIPIRHRGTTIGVLFGVERFDHQPLDTTDLARFESLAASLSIVIHNTILFAEMSAMFLGTLRALSASIDAKDNYTHGHSNRVALLTRQLADHLRTEPRQAERLYLSALVHDLGKIGVPESILTKQGRLTDTEYEAIKKHPQIGARILADIESMTDLLPGVLSHHERWAGGGYPQGLSGNAIPFQGRVIALADSFDAMRSKRSYRNAMTHQQALNQISENAGTQFDPQLADAFLKLDFTNYNNQLEQTHRQAA